MILDLRLQCNSCQFVSILDKANFSFELFPFDPECSPFLMPQTGLTQNGRHFACRWLERPEMVAILDESDWNIPICAAFGAKLIRLMLSALRFGQNWLDWPKKVTSPA